MPIEAQQARAWVREGLERAAARIGLRIPGLTRTSAPLGGYTEHRHEIAHVDPLSDEDLARLNGLLDWKAFTVDRHGRRFGGVAWSGKRDRPQAVPDRRILLLNERFPLADKDVLEFGCFEGIHTVGLCRLAQSVTAVDARIENVAKTIVRTAFYGYRPTVFLHDVEAANARIDLLQTDVLHHVGVLYHLSDPVGHLLKVGRYVRLGLMLDTHYALPEEARATYVVDGKSYPYKHVPEYGFADVFSGLHPHSKWLPLDLITELLRESGFASIDVVETRAERNGPRALLFASRS